MRKAVLALPIVALLLGATVLLADAGGTFTASNSPVVVPTAQPTAPMAVSGKQESTGWHETATKTKSGIQP